MNKLFRYCILVVVCAAFAVPSRAGGNEVEAAQLLTYVKPVLPADAPADGVQSVSFTAVLGADGKLRDLVTTSPDSARVASARDAASQWVYAPYKRKGKPIDKDVYITVYLSGREHEATVDHPVRVSGGVVARLVQGNPAPLRSPGGSGSVVLMGIIGRDGSVENAKVMSGPESMGEVALRAVRGWSYRPYLMDGVPVEIETTMRVNFGS